MGNIYILTRDGERLWKARQKEESAEGESTELWHQRNECAQEEKKVAGRLGKEEKEREGKLLASRRKNRERGEEKRERRVS
jgi:hypothetical protein